MSSEVVTVNNVHALLGLRLCSHPLMTLHLSRVCTVTNFLGDCLTFYILALSLQLLDEGRDHAKGLAQSYVIGIWSLLV